MRSYYRYVPQNSYAKKELDEIDRQSIQRVADAVAEKRRLELVWLILLLLLTLVFIVPLTSLIMRASVSAGLMFLLPFMVFPLFVIYLAMKGKRDSAIVWEECNIAYGTIISERREVHRTRRGGRYEHHYATVVMDSGFVREDGEINDEVRILDRTGTPAPDQKRAAIVWFRNDLAYMVKAV